jgi:hypothetical protein
MNLDQCIFCKGPVLEIRGQFEKLDTYFLTKEDELFLHKIYGSCHSSCMQESKWGGAWYKKRLEYARNMGFRVVAMGGNYCLLDRGQAWEVYYADGTKASLGKEELHQASGIMQMKQQYNLELDDTLIVVAIRATLEAEGSYTLWKLIEHLKIEDRMLRPEQLQNAIALNQTPLAPAIGNWLGLKLVYNYQLPQELINLSK